MSKPTASGAAVRADNGELRTPSPASPRAPLLTDPVHQGIRYVPRATRTRPDAIMPAS